MNIRAQKFDNCTMVQMEQICDLLQVPRHQRPFKLEMLENMYQVHIGTDYQFVPVRVGLEMHYECKNSRFKTSARQTKAMALAGLLIQMLSKQQDN